MSRFISRQKTSWAQARVKDMSIEEIKVVNIVKLIPDMKLMEECAEILNKPGAKLEDIEQKVASYKMSKSMAENMATVPTPSDKSAATYNRNGAKGNFENRNRSNATLYCNRCNNSRHRAADCRCIISRIVPELNAPKNSKRTVHQHQTERTPPTCQGEYQGQ